MASLAGKVVVAAVEGVQLTPDEEAFFKRHTPAGVTLFRRNIPQQNYHDVKILNSQLQGLCSDGHGPIIVAIDQEGGRVSRMPRPAFPNMGPALKIADGRTTPESLELLHEYGLEVGVALLEVGVNVNFAPVLDILTEPSNLAIGDRVFGLDPASVVARAGAYLAGLQQSGVQGCLKHFPGQGDAKADTHLSGAAIDVSLSTLWQREMEPFRRLSTNCQMVMISHAIYPALCSKEASRSSVILQQWLRGRFGFGGVIVSDDMMMAAMPQDRHEWTESLIDALMAGCDLLLVCRHLDRCYAAVEALDRAAAKSPSVSKRLEEASSRVTSFRRKSLVKN
jgi:beta-N-acetylhexosaminidase